MEVAKKGRAIRSIRESLKEYGRGVAGGLLFSVPLLYTMEVWWRGFTADPAALLLYLLVTYVVLLGYNRYSGMHSDAGFIEVLVESIEEMGLGLVIAAGILHVTGRIDGRMPAAEILGKIVIEAMTVAIGVSVGTAQLGVQKSAQAHGSPLPGADSTSGSRPDLEDGDAAESSGERAAHPDPWAQLVLGFCGAVLIASNVAPTEEIIVIASEVGPAKLLALAALSLAVCALVLTYSGFIGSDRHVRHGTLLWTSYGAVSSYALALAASALMLWFFGRFDGNSVFVILAQTVVLGFPAALGASAGRLLIQ